MTSALNVCAQLQDDARVSKWVILFITRCFFIRAVHLQSRYGVDTQLGGTLAAPEFFESFLRAGEINA